MTASRFLAGRVALVTGSVRGLGLAIARAVASAGGHVVLHGFDAEQPPDDLIADFDATYGVRAIYSDADLRVPSRIARLVTEAQDTFGAVDIVVNNAVVRHAAPVESFPIEAWDDALAVNLTAAFHTVRLAVPGMKARRWGRIVNISSIYGLRGAANRVAYVTTKTALIGLTRAIALETVGHGVTCNAVCPGTTETPIHEQAIRAAMAATDVPRSEAERAFFSGKQPTGRFIAAADVAATVLFLCGDAAKDITGSVFPVDGGWSAG